MLKPPQRRSRPARGVDSPNHIGRVNWVNIVNQVHWMIELMLHLENQVRQVIGGSGAWICMSCSHESSTFEKKRQERAIFPVLQYLTHMNEDIGGETVLFESLNSVAFR